MKRKTMLPVLLFAFSATVLVFMAGIRGNFFQASLIDGGDGVQVGSGGLFHSPSLFASSTGETLEEFPVDGERTRLYQEGMLGGDGSMERGMFFPRIYQFDSASTGMVDIAFEPVEELFLQRSLRLTLSYPGRVMRYAGTASSTASGATLLVDSTQPNLLVVELRPEDGTIWRFDESHDPFLSLPMEVLSTASLLPGVALQMRIVSVEHVLFDSTIEEVSFLEAPVDLLYFLPPEGNTGIRPTATMEVSMPGTRPAATMEFPTMPTPETVDEVTPPADVPSPQLTEDGTVPAGSTQAFRMPLLTQDQTRISPPLIREGSGERVYVYLSVSDPDGQEDLSSVEMDLSAFGLSDRVPLVQVSTGPLYSVFGGSFQLPDSIPGREAPYEIPYRVFDKGSNVLRGALPFVVRPAPNGGQSSSMSSNLPGSSTRSSDIPAGVSLLGESQGAGVGQSANTMDALMNMDLDLNQDGKIDDTDLAIYLFAFQLNKD